MVMSVQHHAVKQFLLFMPEPLHIIFRNGYRMVKRQFRFCSCGCHTLGKFPDTFQLYGFCLAQPHGSSSVPAAWKYETVQAGHSIRSVSINSGFYLPESGNWIPVRHSEGSRQEALDRLRTVLLPADIFHTDADNSGISIIVSFI